MNQSPPCKGEIQTSNLREVIEICETVSIYFETVFYAQHVMSLNSIMF